ncbi:MAG: hypothetical protein ACRCSB_05210 [Bacteroidales bacterium]
MHTTLNLMLKGNSFLIQVQCFSVPLQSSMLKKITIILFLSLALFGVFSCANIQKISVGGVRNLEMKVQGLSKFLINLEVFINNNSRHNVKIYNVSLKFTQKDKQIGLLSLSDTLYVSKRSQKYYPLQLELRFPNLLSVASLFQSELAVENLMVEGELSLQIAFFKKVMRIVPQTLASFSEQYGNLLKPIIPYSK